MLVWLRRAIADRDAQLDYIAQDNPRAAMDQGDRIVNQVGQLVQHPEMGRAGRKQGTRELVVNLRALEASHLRPDEAILR